MAREHVIGRVTLHGLALAGDPAAGRAWTRDALASVDLDGIVPPAATLVLRSAAVGARNPRGALRDTASAAVRQAVRPALEPVGASAEAVLFADDAELLACLARAALDGSFDGTWWWLVPRGADSGALPVLARTWVQRVRAVPAALHALARTGQAGEVLRLLPAAAVRALAAAAVHAGVLPAAVATAALEPQPTAPPAVPGATAEPDGAVADGALAAEPARAVADGACAAERTRATADVAAAPAPAARLGTALLLAYRAPFVLGALPGGAQAVAALLSPPPSRAPATRGSTPPGGRTATARTGATGPAPRAAATPPLPPRAPGSPPRPRTVGHVPPAASSRAGRAAGPATAGPPPRADTGQATGLAGAFLLVTVALDLGLYPDFTRPRDPGLPMSPWRWLAHTTAQLVGHREDDPLWALLAELSPDADDRRPGRAPELRPTTRRVGQRLDAALGRRRSAPRVIVRPGVVYAGPARVDVVFPLDRADLAIRMCGLDIDPGWLPAAGRDVRLHYR